MLDGYLAVHHPLPKSASHRFHYLYEDKDNQSVRVCRIKLKNTEPILVMQLVVYAFLDNAAEAWCQMCWVHECQARESRVVSLVNEVRILGYLLNRLLVFVLPILLLALVVCYDEPVAAALILL